MENAGGIRVAGEGDDRIRDMSDVFEDGEGDQAHENR